LENLREDATCKTRVDGKIILNSTLQKQGVKICTGFDGLRIEPNAELQSYGDGNFGSMRTENFMTIRAIIDFPRISYPMQLLGLVVILFSLILTIIIYINTKLKPKNYTSVTP
jgi:hypothetical protein